MFKIFEHKLQIKSIFFVFMFAYSVCITHKYTFGAMNESK